MTVLILVSAVKRHLCGIAKDVKQVLASQGADHGAVMEDFQEVLDRLKEQAARLDAIEATLAEIKAAVAEPDVAAGITLTIQSQQEKL